MAADIAGALWGYACRLWVDSLRHVKIWQGLKWCVLGISIGSLLLAIFFMWHTKDATVPEKTVTKDKSSNTNVDRPLIIERKGDKILWRLQAEKAEQIMGKGMHMQMPKLDLFTESGERIPVVGNEAWFNPLTRSIRFSGDVKVHYKTWRLSCKKLEYDHATEQVNIPGSFEATDHAVLIRGKKLTVFRTTQRLRVDQGVWIRDTHPEHLGIQ